MLKWIALKLETLSYRFELFSECITLKRAGRILPRFFPLRIFADPTRYDDFINMLCFVSNSRKVNLVDIGANSGSFTKDFSLFYPKVDAVYCFEPLENLKEFIEQTNCNLANLKIFSTALGAKSERKTISYPMGNTTHASFYKYNKNSSKFYQDSNLIKSSVNVSRLDEFIDLIDTNNPLIIKIDTQGHEVEVIEGGLNVLALADLVLIECSFAPEYETLDPTFAKVCNTLASVELHPILFQKYSKDISYYCFERDVIFVKKNLLSKIYYENYE